MRLGPPSLHRAAACLAWAFSVGAVVAACRGSSPGASSADGGDDAADAADDFTLLDEPECNPCQAVCACTPGDTFFNTGQCEWVTCVDGTWGGGGMCLGLGCDEAGDDGGQDGPSPEASADGSSHDAGDSGPEAGAGDAAVDATGDGPVDAGGQ